MITGVGLSLTGGGGVGSVVEPVLHTLRHLVQLCVDWFVDWFVVLTLLFLL